MEQISKLVAEFAGRKPVRTGSLIISVFGDAVSQHGSAVWLGSLIKVLEPFGLNQRQNPDGSLQTGKRRLAGCPAVGQTQLLQFYRGRPKTLREGRSEDLQRQSADLGQKVDPCVAYFMWQYRKRIVAQGVSLAWFTAR